MRLLNLLLTIGPVLGAKVICDPVIDIHCGNKACIALKGDGTAETWGSSSNGGDSSGVDLTDVAEVHCGGIACGAINNDGTAEFWGAYNWSSTEDIAGIGCTPYEDTCWAWTTDGIGYTWGSSYTDDKPEPLTDLEDLVCGYYDCIGLKTDGTALAWGYYWDRNASTTGTQYTTDVAKIGCGIYSCWIMKTDGTAMSYGYPRWGVSPSSLDFHTDVEDMAFSSETGVLHTDGTVKFYGYYTGIFGEDDNTAATDVAKVSCGGYQCAVLKTDGTIEAFGYYTANSSKVGGDVIDISCGGYVCVALKSDGTVKGFGWSYYGAKIPEGLTDVAKVNCGVWYSGCTAILTDGTGVSWGSYGTIGSGEDDGESIVGNPNQIDLVNDCVPTLFPTSHPTPSATCVDDSSWYKDDSPEKDCVWVGEKKKKRCSKLSNSANGMIPASSACKASCNTCFTPTTFPTLMPTPCGESDSTTWHKWRNPNKDCEWVSKRPKKRCSLSSKKVDGVWGDTAKAGCRATCCDY